MKTSSFAHESALKTRNKMIVITETAETDPITDRKIKICPIGKTRQ